MKHRNSEQSRKYHNRVAARYDNIYDDPYWEFHDRITWDHLRDFVPRNQSATVLDVGCGTGKWGFKLLKMGYATIFSDHSPGMLEQVELKLAQWRAMPDLAGKAARATVLQADVVELAGVPPDHVDLIVAMGDVVSICSDPAGSLATMRRALKPGGVLVFTVDNLLAGLDHYAEIGDLEQLAAFAKTGATQWLTRDKSERFSLRMFSPSGIRKLVEDQGLSLVSMIGKTILPVRKNKKLFLQPDALERMLKAESLLARDPTALARAGHLQLAVRREPPPA